jgi:hypothetical protein
MIRALRWLHRRTGGVAAALSLVASLAGARSARADCGEDGPWGVGLSAGLGVAAGATGGLVSAGVISAVDDTRDFDFVVGAFAAIGVTSGLSLIYALYDGSTGCEMSLSSPGYVVWSIPVVMVVVGAALPIAIWGAADEIGAEGTEPPPTAAMFRF